MTELATPVMADDTKDLSALSPGLWLARAGKRAFGGSQSKGVRMFVRNHYRKWCVDRELAVKTRWGFEMLASPHDYASYGIYFFGDYDPRMSDVVRHVVRPGQVVWDVGGERGWFTLLCGELVGSGGRVDAFEAFPANAARLKRNVALNGYRHVHVNAVAVSERAGEMYFEPPSDAAAGGKGFLSDCSGVGYLTTKPSAAAIAVPVVSLDEHARQTGIERLDFIKMDIEGAEVAALRGARQTLARFRPVIAVEYNRGTLVRAGSSLEELDGVLEELGYERCVYNGVKFRPVDLKQCEGKADEYAVFNVYAFPRKN